MLRPGDTVAGRFRVERIAGTGGMGTVARALDLHDSKRPVAIKTMSAGQSAPVERFEREVAMLARLDHPHIVGYIDHGVLPNSAPWLAMEWIDGCTLDELLRAKGVTVGETLSLAHGLAAGLAAAHAAGIIHRDIKPNNLLLPSGDPAAVKIADFGVARLNSFRPITRTGVAVGTPGYMAPEQAQGHRNVDARADMFSIGAVLYECLAGRPAFPGEHVVAVLAKVLLEQQPSLTTLRPGTPVELNALIERLLAKKPADRPADGAELVTALARMSLEEEIGADRDGARAEKEIVTNSEQRLVSLVLVEQHAAALEETVSAMLDETVSIRRGAASGDDPLLQIADRNRARLERLIDGTAIMIFAGQLAATDLAIRAARTAREAMALPGNTRVAVATGRAILGQKWPVGEAVEQAATLLMAERIDPGGRVLIDELTAGLIGSRFDIERSVHGRVLGAERDRPTPAPQIESETPCVGRERELGLMGGVFAECVEEESPRSIVVIAPPGAGKTRVVLELERRLQDEDGHWLLAQADALRTRAPYTLMRDLLIRAIGRDHQRPKSGLARIRSTVAHLPDGDAERIAVFLTELAFGYSDDEVPELLRSARRDPLLMSDQLRRALLDWMLEQARSEPLVIVLEDVHWADRTSLELFAQLLASDAVAILLIATARPEVDDSLFIATGTRVQLSELGRKASERLLRSALTDPTPELLATLIDRGGGNPFVLEEMARTAAQTGEAGAAPTALAMAQARLETLSAPQRRVLRAASVFGREFARSAVAALVAGMSDLDDAISELIAENVLRSGDGVLRFRHDLLREAAYESLPEADRQAGHRGAGRWLENQMDAPPLLIAEHLSRGGDRVRASHYYADAGRRSLDRCELADANECVTLGMALEPVAPTRGRLALLRAEICLWRGEVDSAAAYSEGALSELEAPGVEWLHAASVLFQSAGRRGQADRVAQLLEQVRTHRTTCRGSREWLSTTAIGVRELLRNGNYEAATAVLVEVDEELEQADDVDVQLRAVIAYVRSAAALHNGDLVNQLAQIEIAVSLYEQAENARLVCAMRGELGFCYAQLGALDRATAELTRSLAEAEALQLDHVSAWVLALLVQVRTEAGDIDRAVVTGRLAVDAFRSQDDERLAGAARAYLALALAERGELDDACTEANAAVGSLEAFPPLLGFALAVLGRVLLMKDEAHAALTAVSRGIEIRDSIGTLEEGDALLLEAHADALARTGHDSQAATARIAARELVARRAQAISDPTLRRAFETGIAVHRRLLELETSSEK